MGELGSEKIPAVVFELAAVLPKFEGAGLESQLQTFDSLLAVLSPLVRPAFAAILRDAAIKTSDAVSRRRIEAAAEAVAGGGRAAPAYDHEAAMREYSAAHAANFRVQPQAPAPAAPTSPRQVDAQEYAAAIRNANAVKDVTLVSTGIGEAERWLAPDGRLVAWLIVRYFKGEEDYDYYVNA